MTTCHGSCERRRPLRSAEASTGRSRRRRAAVTAIAAGAGVALAVGGVEVAAEEEEEAKEAKEAEEVAAEEEAWRSQLQSRCSCAACPGLVATMLGQALTSSSHGVPRPSSTKS